MNMISRQFKECCICKKKYFEKIITIFYISCGQEASNISSITNPEKRKVRIFAILASPCENFKKFPNLCSDRVGIRQSCSRERIEDHLR